VFRAGLNEFGLLLDTYNIALRASDLQTIFHTCFDFRSTEQAVNSRPPAIQTIGVAGGDYAILVQPLAAYAAQSLL
jgi:hypothetical protein